MKPTEMLDALQELSEQVFDSIARGQEDSGGSNAHERREISAAEFPFAFLEAFGNKETTIKKLRANTKSTSNKSDVIENPALIKAVLQRNNIHIASCETGKTDEALKLLAESPPSAKSCCFMPV